ncbi:MAG: hypothetical protein ABIK83_01510 [Candidatus Zixiibacteriota bacterium]
MVRTVAKSETDWGAVESLVEEIRVTTLNLAIAATKFSGGSEARASVRKSTSDLVNLCLDTVNRVTSVLKTAAAGEAAREVDSEKYLSELETVETNIRDRSRQIMELLRGIDISDPE